MPKVELISFPAETKEKVAGIKRIRSLYGVGLKEGKEIIEDAQQATPITYSDDVPATTQTEEDIDALRRMGAVVATKPSDDYALKEKMREAIIDAVRIDQLEVAKDMLTILIRLG